MMTIATKTATATFLVIGTAVFLLSACGQKEEMPVVDPWKDQAKSQSQITAHKSNPKLASTPAPKDRKTLREQGLTQKAIPPVAFGKPILFGRRELRLFRSEEESPLALIDFTNVTLRVIGTSWTQLRFSDIRDHGRICVAKIPEPIDAPLSISLAVLPSPETPYTMTMMDVVRQVQSGENIDTAAAMVKEMENTAQTNVPAFLDTAKKLAGLLAQMLADSQNSGDPAQTSATLTLSQLTQSIADAKPGQDKSAEFQHLRKCMEQYEKANFTELLQINGQ